MPTLALLPLILGCAPSEECAGTAECVGEEGGDLLGGELDCATTPDVNTVIACTWTTQAAADTWIRYTFDGVAHDTPTIQASGAGEHTTLLLGIPPSTDVTIQSMASVGGNEEARAPVTVRTGGLPNGIPAKTVTVYEPDLVDPDSPYLLGSTIGDNALWILDREGNHVWYKGLDRNYLAPEALPARSGQGLLYNWFHEDFGIDESEVRSVDMDGVDGPATRTVLAHHVFQELPDGRIAFAQIDVREVKDAAQLYYDGTGEWPDDPSETSVVGDNLTITDGTDTEVIWSSWDGDIPLEYNEGWDVPFYPQGWDWTHGNGLYYVEEHNSLLFSLANVDVVVEVDVDTGEVLRLFGDAPGAYAFDPPESAFNFQHGAYYTEDGTLLLTNRVEANGSKYTAAREYAVHDDTRTLELVWEYGDPDLYAFAEGMAERLPNGNTIVNFGSVGIIREVTPEGEVVWEVSEALGNFPGHVTALDDLYQLCATCGDSR